MQLTDLKAAFLIAFGALGYGWAMSDELRPVRRALRSARGPELLHATGFTAAPSTPIRENLVFEVAEPHPCVIVVAATGAGMVFPMPGLPVVPPIAAIDRILCRRYPWPRTAAHARVNEVKHVYRLGTLFHGDCHPHRWPTAEATGRTRRALGRSSTHILTSLWDEFCARGSGQEARRGCGAASERRRPCGALAASTSAAQVWLRHRCPRVLEYVFDKRIREREHRSVAATTRSDESFVRDGMTSYRGHGDPMRCWADDLIASDPTILDHVNAWWESSSPVPMVGSRHHTVPRFYLERFSDKSRIHVRDRMTGDGGVRNIKDTGTIRDFYTFINLDGERDGRLERILCDIERGAKAVFDRLLSPFREPRPLTAEEHLHVSLYLAFQIVRTPRQRRESELMGDYAIRAANRSVSGITQVRVVPDPNFHLDYLTKAAPKLAEALFARPTMLVTIDQPLFITCDEPVILRTAGDQSHVRHLPNCTKNQRRRRKDARKPSRTRMRNADTVHLYPARPGLAQAAEVAIPLTPRALLVLGPQGAPQGSPHRAVGGDAAIGIAADVNARLLAHAYQWVAAHPDHPGFARMAFPKPGPIIQVCDGGTTFARDLDQPPSPRRPQLLGRGR